MSALLFHSDKFSSTPLLAISRQLDPVRSNQSNSAQGPFELLSPPDPYQVADVLQVGGVVQVDHASAPNLQRQVTCVVSSLSQVLHTL